MKRNIKTIDMFEFFITPSLLWITLCAWLFNVRFEAEFEGEN